MALTDNGIATLGELTSSLYPEDYWWPFYAMADATDTTQCLTKKNIRSKFICAISDTYEDDQLVPFTEIARPLSATPYTLVIDTSRLLTPNTTNTSIQFSRLQYTINYGDGTFQTNDLGGDGLLSRYSLSNNKYTFSQSVYIAQQTSIGGVLFNTQNITATVYREDGTSINIPNENIAVSLSGNQFTIKVGEFIVNPDLPPIETGETRSAIVEFIAAIPFTGYVDLFPVEIKIGDSSLTSENYWVMPADSYCTPTGVKPSFTFNSANVLDTIYYRIAPGYGEILGQAGTCRPSSITQASTFGLGSTILTNQWTGVRVSSENMQITINYQMLSETGTLTPIEDA